MDELETVAKLLYEVYQVYQKENFDREKVAQKYSPQIKAKLTQAYNIIQPKMGASTVEIVDALILSIRMIGSAKFAGLVPGYETAMHRVIDKYNPAQYFLAKKAKPSA